MSAPIDQPLNLRLEEILSSLPPFAGIRFTRERLRELGPLAEVLPAVRALCADHPSPRVRFHAERVLRMAPDTGPAVELGDPPDPFRVEAALRHDAAEVRLRAVGACPRLASRDGAKRLLAHLARGEPDHWVLSQAVRVLGELGHPPALGVVRELLAHESPRVQANALEALRGLAPDAAAEAARSRIGSLDNRVRANAVLALARQDPGRAWQLTCDMVRSQDVWMRASGVFLVTRLAHPLAEELLLDVLAGEQDPELVVRILSWLEGHGGARSLGALAFFASDGTGPHAEDGVRALSAVRVRHPVEDGALRGAREAFEQRRREALEMALASRRTGDELLAGLVEQAADPREAKASEPVREDADPAPRPPPRSPPPPSAVSASAVDAAVLRQEAEEQEKLRRLAAGGACIVFLLVVAALVFSWGRTRTGILPDRGPVGEESAVGSGEPRGFLELAEAPWQAFEGRVERSSAKLLELEYETGERQILVFKRWLDPVPPRGAEVVVEGPVLRRGRRSVTLGEGATVEW